MSHTVALGVRRVSRADARRGLAESRADWPVHGAARRSDFQRPAHGFLEAAPDGDSRDRRSTGRIGDRPAIPLGPGCAHAGFVREGERAGRIGRRAAAAGHEFVCLVGSDLQRRIDRSIPPARRRRRAPRFRPLRILAKASTGSAKNITPKRETRRSASAGVKREHVASPRRTLPERRSACARGPASIRRGYRGRARSASADAARDLERGVAATAADLDDRMPGVMSMASNTAATPARAGCPCAPAARIQCRPAVHVRSSRLIGVAGVRFGHADRSFA